MGRNRGAAPDTATNPSLDRAGEPVAPPDEAVDPRAVLVTVAGADAAVAPAPIVVAPGRAAAEPQSGPTVDGLPTTATLELLGRERATLRDGAAASGAAASGAAASGAAAPGAAAPGGDRHRVLLPAPDPGPGIGGHEGADRREVVVDGWRIEVEIRSASRAALRDLARRGREETGHSGPTQVHAIIPGVVVSVSVAPGDMVTAGQQLLVVEAMKMQNELRSPRDGTIERVAVGMGARIDAGDLLLVLA